MKKAVALASCHILKVCVNKVVVISPLSEVLASELEINPASPIPTLGHALLVVIFNERAKVGV